MTGFVLRRILSAALVIVLTSMFVFVLFFVGMGDRPSGELLRAARVGPLHAAQARLDRARHGPTTSPSSATTASGSTGIFVGRKNVYMDGKFYDCPAPCLGISITSQRAGVDRARAAISRDADLGHRRRGHLPHRRGHPRCHGRPMAWPYDRPSDRGRHVGDLVDPPLRDRTAGVDLLHPQAARSSPTPATTRSPRTRSRRSAT